MPIVIKSGHKTIDDLPAFMTEAEAANFLNVDPKKLRRLAYDKRGPKTVRIGNVHRIRREDLAEWLEAHAS